MSEQNPEAQTSEEQPQEGAEQREEPKTFDADYVANLRKEAARYRTEAKAAAAELEQHRKASMTEAEKAVAEAEARGRTAAAIDFGKRLARAEFDAQAGRRNPEYDTAGALDLLDLSRFVKDDGDLDSKAIKAAVERLVPAPNTTPSYDGGTRTPTRAVDMNKLIRQASGRE